MAVPDGGRGTFTFEVPITHLVRATNEATHGDGAPGTCPARSDSRPPEASRVGASRCLRGGTGPRASAAKLDSPGTATIRDPSDTNLDRAREHHAMLAAVLVRGAEPVIDTVETPRLLLRPFAPDDWRAVHAYASDPAVMKYIPGGAMSEDQVRAFAGQNEGDEAKAAVVLKPEDRLIGHLPFHPWYAPRIYEIGWVFDPRYHGRGYATEAAAALLRHGFETLGLHRIVATCQPENAASWRVMEKIGMRREAHFRRCFQVDESTWLDEYLYAILEEDWFAGVGPPGLLGATGG